MLGCLRDDCGSRTAPESETRPGIFALPLNPGEVPITAIPACPPTVASSMGRTWQRHCESSGARRCHSDLFGALLNSKSHFRNPPNCAGSPRKVDAFARSTGSTTTSRIWHDDTLCARRDEEMKDSERANLSRGRAACCRDAAGVFDARLDPGGIVDHVHDVEEPDHLPVCPDAPGRATQAPHAPTHWSRTTFTPDWKKAHPGIHPDACHEGSQGRDVASWHLARHPQHAGRTAPAPGTGRSSGSHPLPDRACAPAVA